MDEQELNQAKAEYERFKLTWMLDHGFSLANLIHELDAIREDSEPDINIENLFQNWEFDCGFGSQIWPCFAEFLDVEYREMQAYRNQAKMPGFSGDAHCKASIVAQLKSQQQEPKKTAPKKSAEKEI